ncbi:polyprenyl synthetase [Apiospora kogelbergensis]|uniref:polyprenyl synthetase n=1 Tax=Apiospora kogelbergensis TaxID=1337665 RepID=UPI00312FC496
MALTQAAQWRIRSDIPSPPSEYENEEGVVKTVLGDNLISVPPEKSCFPSPEFSALHPVPLQTDVGDPEASDNNSSCGSLESIHTRVSSASAYGENSKTVDMGRTDGPPADTEAVMAPFYYISALPSKGVRDQLIEILNLWVGASPESLDNTKTIIRDIHNLSLMLDDVQDNSPMRRAKPSTHCVFGMPQTVNSATYQIVDVISRAQQLHHAESLEVVLDQYLKMVDGKTGGLFRMISRLMIAQSDSPQKPESLDRLMTLFGRFFQIYDDYVNISSAQYTKTKGFAEDLDEGKYSFLLIHALEHARPAARAALENLLMRRRVVGHADACQKDFTIGLFRETGSLASTTAVLRALRRELEDEVARLEAATGKANPGLRKVIGAFRIDED